MKRALILFSLVLFGFITSGAGFLLKNVGSGRCVKDMDPKKETTRYTFADCSSTEATDFEFLVGREDGQQRLASPFVQASGRKPNKKCAYTNTGGTKVNDNVWSAGCNGRQYCPYLQWRTKDVGDDKFILIQNRENWCVKPNGWVLQVYETCDESDPEFQWTKP